MNQYTLVLVVSMICGILLWRGQAEAPAAEATAMHLHELYGVRDYFALREQVGTLDAHDPHRLFLEGQLDAAFLRDDPAEDKLQRFLQLPDMDAKWRQEALLTLGETYLRQSKYKVAAGELIRALAEFGPQFTADERLVTEQDLSNAKVLQEAPPQTRSDADGVSTVEATREAFGGRVYLDVQVNGSTEPMLLDTGAGQSFVSESFAHRHKLQMLPGTAKATSATGGNLDTHLALADTLQIGKVTLRHVTFAVFPDQDLARTLGGKVDGAIGFPVLLACKRWRVAPDGRSVEVGEPATGPAAVDASTSPNLACDGGIPLVRVECQDQSLTFVLDTGDEVAGVFPRFGERFPQALIGAKPFNGQSASIGSKPGAYTRYIPRLEVSVHGEPVVARGVIVRPEAIAFFPGAFGVLGADPLRFGYEVDLSRMILVP